LKTALENKMKQKGKTSSPSINIITPKGVAIHPWLEKPDTKYNANGIFKVTLRVPGEEALDLVAKIDEAIAREHEKAIEV
jgi:hypothetical protein